MSMEFENMVRCINCKKEFHENEVIYDGDEDMEFCPYCGEGNAIKDIKSYEQKCEELKRKCFDLGANAMEDLLGVSLEFETDETMFEFADGILAQMPDEEFEMLYDRYCGGNNND